jgi:hypothetical protein
MFYPRKNQRLALIRKLKFQKWKKWVSTKPYHPKTLRYKSIDLSIPIEWILKKIQANWGYERSINYIKILIENESRSNNWRDDW